MGDIINTIKERRSVRKYKNIDVPKEKIKRILEAANWAPSNANSQPWKFYVLKKEYLNKVSGVFYKWSKEYIPKADYIPENKKNDMIEYSKNFGGAQNLVVVTYEAYENDKHRTEESLMASCAAVQNICLAAKEEDLGTVWITGHVTHDPETRKILNLDNNEKIAAIIPVGYPAVNPPAPPREDSNLVDKVKWMGF
ncbi:MAG: nitroreductase family protein [Firmicutes bacterium]|nr:nitroreductase family protein [Bacillota bacterium]